MIRLALTIAAFLAAAALPCHARDIGQEIAQALDRAAQTHARQHTADPELRRLRAELRALDDDASLTPFATWERLRAYRALDDLVRAAGRERRHRLFMAERRVATATTTAQAEWLRSRAQQLDREYQGLLDAGPDSPIGRSQ